VKRSVALTRWQRTSQNMELGFGQISILRLRRSDGKPRENIVEIIRTAPLLVHIMVASHIFSLLSFTSARLIWLIFLPASIYSASHNFAFHSSANS